MIKYDLIFYLSRKTSYSEKRLKKALKKHDYEINRIQYCTDTRKLGELTIESLTLTKLVVIIGGLSEMSDENLATVLSRVLSSAQIPMKNVRKLCANDLEGYLVKYKSQAILALPDYPDAIQNMLSDSLINFIKK